MNVFKDFYSNEVKLSFENHPFSKDPRHVWIICQYKNKWLLTKHKETDKEAAIREVMDETGALLKEITYLAQYYVVGKSDSVIKNVYFAKVDQLTNQPTYYETEGPVLLDKLPEDISTNKKYSFMMKDDVLYHCLNKIKTK